RCALLLVSQQEDGRYEIEPIAGMGPLPREIIIFPAKDRFITLLAEEHQPLLQYDIDFNPVYSDINEAHDEWLKEMAMEGYVPISDGGDLAGIIAAGPKGTGLPYQSNELELMQTLADQTIVALQNARLYSVLNAQNEQVRLLNEDLVDQNEKLEVMDRVKTDFITIASHELRTPLTQVKGYADILAAMNEENALSRDQTREIVGHINRATLQLEGLITDMLETSQLDVDEMRLTFVKTRLQSIIKLAMEPLIQALRERRITLTQEGVDELPPIYADYKRLVQAFTKLLGNAVKYTPDDGRITVTATLVPSADEEKEYFEVIIQDSGIGIDPKYHELIFEKFFRIGDPQLHSTGSTKFKGAGPGLGLPIAKGVIEGHHGRIWVESEGEDEQRMPGSSFHIILPVKPAEVEIEPIPELEERPSYLIG
ncbi:MAG: GAF domain-containing sensor histidine kinase, partial [Chloroflexi bacterium]|nr:GAF domain-containing sensor histidine kinase [Chloroflexota bacterium]